MFDKPLDPHRIDNRATCTLCQLPKELGRDGRLCGWCIGYIAWRKKWMPDGRTFRNPLDDTPAARELRIVKYEVRAEFEIPLFDDDGKESAA